MTSHTKTPLVSVLVPAYNPRFVARAVASALAQDYANVEIIIRDDCRSEEVREAIFKTAGTDSRIDYVWNARKKGGLHNYVECMSAANGEFIKFLNDDDVLAPACVTRMAAILSAHEDVTLVTSYRRRIDERGELLPDIGSFSPLVKQDSIINGPDLANFLLFFRSNRIGEPTATMFRRKDVIDIKPHFMCFGDSETPGVGDMALWLNLLCRGNLAYLIDTLVDLRMHSAQRQKDPEIQAAVKDSWRKLRHHARHVGISGQRMPIRFRSRPMRSTQWTWTYVSLRYLIRGFQSVIGRASASGRG